MVKLTKIWKLTDPSGSYVSTQPLENVPDSYQLEQGYFISVEQLREAIQLATYLRLTGNSLASVWRKVLKALGVDND